MTEIETKFLLTRHLMGFLGKKNPYPAFKTYPFTAALLDSVEEAESILRKRDYYHDYFHAETYCHVISELPVGIQFSVGESLTERIYLPDGQLWSTRDYADLIPDTIPPEYSESDFDSAISRRLLFEGCSPEEIRFKKGDIIEVFTPMVGGASSAELAIVVDTPPTKEDIKERMVLYRNKKPPRHLLDRGFLGARFGSYDDFYTVISDHLPTNANPFPYYCPTHYAMRPRFKVPPEIQTQLQKMLERI